MGYPDISFRFLDELAEVGINDVVILLNAAEFEKANQTQFIVFDKPRTIIEHYKNHNKHLKIKVINTKQVTTEQEKLEFYLNRAKGGFDLNLFLCQEAIRGVNEELSAKPLFMEFTELRSAMLPFFSRSTQKQLPFPLFKSPCSSKEAIELLQHQVNPCFCYKTSMFDILYYQWLFNIFVELINLQSSHEETKSQLERIINNFNKNITDFKNAEIDSEKTLRVYGTSDKASKSTAGQRFKNAEKLKVLEKNFPKLITELIKLYELLSQKDHHDIKEDPEYKNLNEHMEGKPFI